MSLFICEKSHRPGNAMGQERVLAEQQGLEGWHTCVENATPFFW